MRTIKDQMIVVALFALIIPLSMKNYDYYAWHSTGHVWANPKVRVLCGICHIKSYSPWSYRELVRLVWDR